MFIFKINLFIILYKIATYTTIKILFDIVF